MTTNQNAELPRVIEPCEHMDNMVNGLADGSLKGPAKLYTKFHVATCSKCRTALAALEDIHSHLNQLDHAPETPANANTGLTSERREALDAEMTLVEQQNTKSAS